MQRVCVTGGAGFIGGHVVDCLLEDPSITCVLNLDAMTYAASQSLVEQHQLDKRYFFEKVRLEQTSDQVRALLIEHQIDTVFHLAAESHVDRSILDPSPFIQSNILGTYALLEAVRGLPVPLATFMHISTDEVYGSLAPGEPLFDEHSRYQPSSPYSASKAASDHLVSCYRHTYGLNAMITHCTNNYGPRQYAEKLIPMAIQAILAGDRIPIYGSGENVRDWLHVTDHARALCAIAQRGTAPVYTISAGQRYSNLALITRLCDIVDEKLGNTIGQSRNLMHFVTDRLGHDFAYGLTARRLIQNLGWRPHYTIEAGLINTVEWYLQGRTVCTSPL